MSTGVSDLSGVSADVVGGGIELALQQQRVRSIGGGQNTAGSGASFIDPATAVLREQAAATAATAAAAASSTPTASPRPSVIGSSAVAATSSGNTLRYSIPINAATGSSSAGVSASPSGRSTPGTPQTGGGGAKTFVIVKKSTGTPGLSPSPSPFPASSRSTTPLPAATAMTTASKAEVLEVNAAKPMEQPSPAMQATMPLDVPGMVELPPNVLSITHTPATDPSFPSSSLLDPSSSEEVPLPSSSPLLPANHPASFVRPPTPPSTRSRRRASRGSLGAGAITGEDKRASRSISLSPSPNPGNRKLSLGSGKEQFLNPGSNFGSPAGSGKDQFRLPVPSSSSSAASSSTLSAPALPILAFGQSFDVGSGNEFSTALRAALLEAGAGAESKSWKNRGAGGDLSNRSSTGLTLDSPRIPENGPVGGTVPSAPSEEASEREMRKQAIRAKNAMHMRLRNASVGGNMLSGARQPSVNRAALAAAANAANAKAAEAGHSPMTHTDSLLQAQSPTQRSSGGKSSPHTSPTGVQRSMTFQPRSPQQAVGGSLFDRAFKQLEQEQQQAEEKMTILTPGMVDSSANTLGGSASPNGSPSSTTVGLLSPSSSNNAAPRRTRSSILKPTTPIAQDSTTTAVASAATSNNTLTSPQQPAAKRQLSGILRMPSVKSGQTSMTPAAAPSSSSSSSSDALPPSSTGPALQRTNTAGSRVGFVVPEGEDSDGSSDDSADEAQVGDPANVQQPNGVDSPRSKHGQGKASVVTSVGIPSLHHHSDDPTRMRKQIFMQNGDQLMLRSVSTTAGGYQSHQAANVMVLSVSSIFTRLRLYCDLCFYLAMIGVILTVLQKELHFQYPNNKSADIVITVIRSLTSISTGVLIFCLYRYYQADFQFLQLNRVYLLRSAFWNTQLIWQFAVEVVICLIHEPPLVNHDVDMSVTDAATLHSYQTFPDEPIALPPVVVRNPWSLLIALRFYFILRLILSRYYTGGTKILGLWFNFQFNIPFAIRNMLYSHPLLSLAPVVGILIFGCSYSLWVFEREGTAQFSFGTALWVTLITITAVGYGDITPISSGGRAICILSAFIGILTAAVLVAAVHQKLTLLPYEGRMVEFLERDSNSIVLKYFASRCISRSWKYYFYRKKCIRMVALRKFDFIARANLLRHKTVMLQGIFDFQTARKQIQAYDRRYHSEQLFRSMLEGLYDKLESMTLDFHVLEDELDLSYEESRKLGARQIEILEEVQKVSKGQQFAARPAGSADAPPEHGRLSLLRTSSLPSSAGGAAASTGAVGNGGSVNETPVFTRPPSGFAQPSDVADQSGRVSAIGSDSTPAIAPGQEELRHGRHKSMRTEDTHEADSSADHHPASSVRIIVPSTPIGILSTGASTAPVSSSVSFDAALSADASSSSRRGGQTHLNSKRASTLGGLDLAAAAAAVSAATRDRAGLHSTKVHRRVGSNEATPSGMHAYSEAQAAAAQRASIRARSSQDLLTAILVDTPRVLPDGPQSARVPGTLARRTSIAAKDVTSDLLSVVAALSPTNNPDLVPAPAGRIRFGESDFAAHRAASGAAGGARASRQTIMIQRGKTQIDRAGSIVGGSTGGAGASSHSPDGKSPGEGIFRPHFRRPSSMEMLLQQQSAAQGLPSHSPLLFHSQTTPDGSSSGGGGGGGERTASPGGGSASNLSSPVLQSRPSISRAASGGNALRAAATARAATAAAAAGASGSGHHHPHLQSAISGDQFERMMLLLANVSERLAGLEQHFGTNSGSIRERSGSPRKTPHAGSQHHVTHAPLLPSVVAPSLPSASTPPHDRTPINQPVATPTTGTPTGALVL